LFFKKMFLKRRSNFSSGSNFKIFIFCLIKGQLGGLNMVFLASRLSASDSPSNVTKERLV
jgi:hypothetical protein